MQKYVEICRGKKGIIWEESYAKIKGKKITFEKSEK